MDGLDPGAPASGSSGRESVTPRPSFQSSTLKRSRDEVDDMAADGLSLISPEKNPRRMKKAKNSKKGSLQPYAAPDVISIPYSTTPTPQSDPIVSHTVIGPPMETNLKVKTKTEPRLPVPTSASSFEALQERFAQAQYEITQWKERLDEEMHRHSQDKLFLKQTMMLDMIKRHEQASKTTNKLLREKHHLSHTVEEHKAEAEKHKKKVDEESKKHTKAVADVTYYKNEVEHLQALNKVMEEDLDELRQIENEDAAQRCRKAQGLPPAYGSLDDEDPFLTPQLHEDSGSYDVAVFKRTVRDNFMTRLKTAQLESDLLREGANRTAADAKIFLETSTALSDSSRNLKATLDYADQTFHTTMNLYAYSSQLENGNPKDREAFRHSKRMAKRYCARRDFVADRVAKVIIDLCWRVISASELRPCTLKLGSEERTRMNLAYKEADECLLEALRRASTSHGNGFGKDHLLWEYQHYFTQVSAVRRAFFSMRTGLTYPFFVKCLEWLGEQVETERMNRANRPVQERMLEATANAGWIGGSEISSEAARTGSESSVESVS